MLPGHNNRGHFFVRGDEAKKQPARIYVKKKNKDLLNFVKKEEVVCYEEIFIFTVNRINGTVDQS